jgi:hypothetical protein
MDKLLEEYNNLNKLEIDKLTLEKLKSWNYKKIDTDGNQKFFQDNESYYLYKKKLNDEGNLLFILPGLSIKSIAWTVGRISYFLEKYPDKFKKFSEIHIFDFHELKKSKVITDNLAEGSKIISNHLDKIIRNINKDNKKVSILGRSYGGGIAIRLAENDYIYGLNLASPGHDSKIGLSELLSIRDDLGIRLCSTKEDKKVHIKEIIRMIDQIYEINYSEEYFDFEIFSIKPYEDYTNHRIHDWSIQNLI